MTEMQFGTLLVDPPWSYDRTSRHEKLSGYADDHYEVLTQEELAALPIGQLGHDESVLLLWTTWPFIQDALNLIKAWQFEFVTGLPWVKANLIQPVLPGLESDANFEAKLAYGVGFWFRGATEPLLVGRRQKSYRTPLLGVLDDVFDSTQGLIHGPLRHSQKPASVYGLVEKGGFPGPYLEIFAREQRPGWYSLGNECAGDCMDIRKRLALLAEGASWEAHYKKVTT